MIKHIDEVEYPEAGITYWVPHVKQKDSIASGFVRLVGARRDGFIPCRGSLHSDKEIGFAMRHWHYDLRFLTEAALNRLRRGLVLNVDAFREGDKKGPMEERPPTMIKRKLLRLGEIDLDISGKLTHLFSGSVAKVAKGKKHCRICPHKGTLLQLSDVAASSEMICPLHGLKFSPKSGVLIDSGCDRNHK